MLLLIYDKISLKFTLIKWASISKDVSKFIDLLNWFRIQEFHFENLIFN